MADRARRSRVRRRPDSVEISVSLDPGSLGAAIVAVDLRRAADALPRRQRAAVTLHYYIDLPLAEVAEVMGCSLGTVKSTLHDARRALTERLGGTYA